MNPLTSILLVLIQAEIHVRGRSWPLMLTSLNSFLLLFSRVDVVSRLIDDCMQVNPQRSYTCCFPNLERSLPGLNGFFSLLVTGIIVGSLSICLAVSLVSAFDAVPFNVVLFKAVPFNVFSLKAVLFKAVSFKAVPFKAVPLEAVSFNAICS
jgi:hypothetical protein